MKLIERVKYSLLGKPVKTLLLLLVVTLLGSFLSASFSIYQANKSLKKDVKDSLNPIILIEWETERYDALTDDYLEIYDKENDKLLIIEKYRKDSRIKIMENRYVLKTPYLDFQIIDKHNGIYDYTNLQETIDNKTTIFDTNYSVNFIGIDYHKIADVTNKETEMIKGRTFTQEEIFNGDNLVFLINNNSDNGLLRELKNNLETFKLIIPYIYLIDVDGDNKLIETDIDLGEFKVIGMSKQINNNSFVKYHSLFNLNTMSGFYISVSLMDEISNQLKDIYENIANEYPSIKEEYYYEYYGSKFVSETYIELNDANDLKSFIKEIENEGDYLIRNVYSYSDSYNDVQAITKSLSTIAIISLVVCMIASIIILSLIIQVFVHERRYEIGVFLSLGESRRNIIAQIILEVLIIGLLGISISLFTGNMIGNVLSNDLLEKQIEQYEEVYEDIINGQDYEINQEEIMESYRVEITFEYILCVYAGGMVVLLFSCLYPMNNILKMKAKKMLQ